MIFNYKNIPVFYTDEGKGDVILLLHGFLENSSMWNDLIPKLVVKHRVICIDLLGHGQTDCLGYVHSMELMAEVVDMVLNHLNVNKFTIIGHSMGGYVALALAEITSKSITGLCLMNSTTLADNQERQLNRDRAIAAVKQSHKAFVGMAVANLFAPKNREFLASEIEIAKQEAISTPLQGIIAALEGMKVRKDRTNLFIAATFHKCIIIGKKDPVLDYDTTLAIGYKSNAIIVEFPDGHMSHLENKKELAYKLLHFIEK
jgi:pimeloyl-ACP methyl ester carboxylesterase